MRMLSLPKILIEECGKPSCNTMSGGSSSESKYATSESLSSSMRCEAAITPTSPTSGNPKTKVAPGGTLLLSMILTSSVKSDPRSIP